MMHSKPLKDDGVNAKLDDEKSLVQKLKETQKVINTQNKIDKINKQISRQKKFVTALQQ